MRRSRQAAALCRTLSSAQSASLLSRTAHPTASAPCRGLHASAVDRALSKFVMPAMSPTMTEGGIASWQKKEGDTFAPGDVLLEIETDKATMDVEAQDEGKLVKILVGDGTKGVNVGKVIAITGEEGDEADQETIDKLAAEDESSSGEGQKEAESKEEEQPSKSEESSKKPPSDAESEPAKKADSEPKSSSSSSSSGDSKSSSSAPSSSTQPIFASPIAKRIALERGLPLADIKGSGPNGRILRKDVESFKGASSSASSGGSVAPVGKPAPGTPTTGDQTLAPYTDEPVSNMRKVIATRLTESKNSSPHYYISSEIHVDRMLKLREVFNQAVGKDGVKEGTKLSVNDFVVKAAAIALREVPEVNASWMGDKIRQYHRADISIAVATPSGLLTPIVTDCGAKGLATISAQAKALAGKARDGKLQPSEYQGGSFTVSNLGMAGTPVHFFTAVINAPQSAIMAVAGTEQKLVLDPESEKGFKAISVMNVTVSFDHRVVDGAVGSRFVKAFKDALESPLSFML